MHMVLVKVILVTYLDLTVPLLGGSIITCVIEMRRPRHREVRSLAQVTQLLSGGAGIWTQPTQLQRPCFLPQPYTASEGETLRHCHFADGEAETQRVWISCSWSHSQSLDLNPDPLSFLSQAWRATPRTELALFWSSFRRVTVIVLSSVIKILEASEAAGGSSQTLPLSLS